MLGQTSMQGSQEFLRGSSFHYDQRFDGFQDFLKVSKILEFSQL
jgi:hypothetical protein